MKISRRQLLMGGLGGLGLGAVGRFFRPTAAPVRIPGRIVGANAALGHQLRHSHFEVTGPMTTTDVVIVGGGITGLTAGDQLRRAGYRDYQILELEATAGGNSAYGHNAVSAYPWGAHYVPLLNDEAHALRQWFKDVGIITGEDERGRSIYNDYHLCAAPHERLYIYGRWQEGLIPVSGQTPAETAQIRRFMAYVQTLRHRRGRDGRRVFTIPVDHSSQDPEWLALDQLTMQAWLKREGYDAPGLLWYINYACRDDYGTPITTASAWAGLHYFASRRSDAANAEDANVLTWPEGNGYLVQRLLEPQRDHLITQALTYRVLDRGDHVWVDYWNTQQQLACRIEARAAIVATPRFIASRLVQSERFTLSSEGFSYAPWAVANITLSRLPDTGQASLAWDNVVYDSPLLGYVVASHQTPQMHPLKTVLTYYWPLSHTEPTTARQEAMARPYEEWQRIFLDELLRIHPDLAGAIEQVDIWLWGHAMVRPTPGFIWGETRAKARRQHPPVFTAHSDLAGLSLFEEAFTQGHLAALQVIKHLQASREGRA